MGVTAENIFIRLGDHRGPGTSVPALWSHGATNTPQSFSCASKENSRMRLESTGFLQETHKTQIKVNPLILFSAVVGVGEGGEGWGREN